MPKNNNVISITDMTQKAYDRILQEDLSKKGLQYYWYCGIVPIRRYCEQREIGDRVEFCVISLTGAQIRQIYTKISAVSEI